MGPECSKPFLERDGGCGPAFPASGILLQSGNQARPGRENPPSYGRARHRGGTCVESPPVSRFVSLKEICLAWRLVFSRLAFAVQDFLTRRKNMEFSRRDLINNPSDRPWSLKPQS